MISPLTQLISPELIDQVVDECAALVRDEARKTSGMSGVVIKSGLKVIEKVRPRILEDLFYSLLPTFVEKLDVKFMNTITGAATREDLILWMTTSTAEVVEALLSVTDERAERSKMSSLVKVYRKLRPLAEAQVAESLPQLVALIKRHL